MNPSQIVILEAGVVGPPCHMCHVTSPCQVGFEACNRNVEGIVHVGGVGEEETVTKYLTCLHKRYTNQHLVFVYF